MLELSGGTRFSKLQLEEDYFKKGLVLLTRIN